MGIEKFKDVNVGGHEFRVGLVSALIGDWCVSQMMSGNVSNQEVFAKIQAYMLDVCSVYVDAGEERIPKKVFANGRFLVPELELDFDLQLLYDLVEEAMKFNFTPFLLKMEQKAERLKREQEEKLLATTQHHSHRI